jgi:ubiquinone/menaquinone biosynthesis C-methylase UbiE
MMVVKTPFGLKVLFLPLRLFFALLYSQLAWTYDWVADIVSLGMWKSWVLSISDYLNGPRILELGHGPGHLQTSLYTKHTGEGCKVQIVGLDRSSYMGRQAFRRILRKGFKPSLVQGLAQELPFADHTFHQIAGTFPTEYIFDPQTISEVWRVLMPGGDMLIVPLALITGNRPLERLAAWLFRITGQTPPWDDLILEQINQAGFQASAEWITLPSSKLLLVMARKPL